MKKELPTLGLYIHIPFCRQKCAYCDFYSLAHREDKMDAYTDALARHLEEIAPRSATHLVDTVYFGGGTPSYLGEKRLIRLIKLIKKEYPLSKDAEITLEANPDSIGSWKTLTHLRRSGFNRISLGMQSSDDALLKEIGRIHTFEQVQQAVQQVRRAKIDNLSLDLMYGLPGQTMGQWQKTLSDAVALAPEHLSCYALTLEEGTPLYERRASAHLPDDDAQADLYLYTVDYLREQGYAQYEISNFAKPGRESRHNLKYWTLGEYAGFGPGAHSDFGNVRFAYEKDLDAYLRGDLRLSESTDIPPLSRDVEYLMLGLRTVQGIDTRVFENRYRQRFAPLEALLLTYREKGWCEQDGSTWHLTPQGFLVSNQLIGNLLDVLEGEKLRRIKAAERGDFRVV
jgi:oxygen-independent coproporphyrinogen-3 oxidase